MLTIKVALTGVLAFTAATSAALAEPKTNLLSQWSEGSDAAAIAKLGEMFTAAGGKWEQTSIAGHTANTLAKLRADVVAGNAPPAVQLKGPEIAEWNETGKTANLDQIATSEGWDKLVAPELLPVMKPTGHWVAAPMNIHRINWIWGSTKAMEQAGIKGLPKTWAEFNADCDKAVAAHLICIAHFSQDWTDATTFEVVLYGMDEGLFKKAFVEGDTEAMRSPEMIKAFEQFRLMVSKYMDPGIAGRDYDTATVVVTGAVWSWLYSPDAGIEFLVRSLGWHDFTFRLTTNRTPRSTPSSRPAIWQSSGFAMALLLAGLRSVDPDLVKAAQIDGAGPARIYRKVILPSIGPIFVAVIVVLLQFAIKTFDLVVALTRGGPGISTTFPANYVYDLMFQRGEIAVGAAAAIMMLAALAVVLVPYALWTVWRSRREAAYG